MDTNKSAVALWSAALLLTVIFLLIRTAYAGFDQVLFADNDDAMRMAVVRDFLGGQSWFDHMQYRLNTPYGAEMHWSRLVDLPIAALVLLARPLVGSGAETVAGYLWPVILLGVFIWINGQLTLRLVGRDGLLPGMLIAAFSVVTFGEFDFGRIDHHSVQIILTQLAVLFTVDALTRPRSAIWAGLAVATALAIGTEALPVIVAAILVYGVLYVAVPGYHAAVRGFALAFGMGSVAHLLIALPPSQWFFPFCDAISVVYASAGLLAGLGLAGLTLLPIKGEVWPLRLLAGALAGGAVLALVVVLFPNCLAGPYAAVDPWLVDNWLAGIGEAMPLPTVLGQQPVYVVSASVPALLALMAALHAALHSTGTRRTAWLVLATVLGVIIAVAFVQVRSIRMTAALIAPACAYCVLAARSRYLARASLRRAIGLLGSWLGFVGLFWAGLVSFTIITLPAAAPVSAAAFGGERDSCLAPAAYDDLAAMVPQRIMTPLDLGAYMLLYTRNDVVSAPYHRNNQGLLDTFAFFNGSSDEARAILDERGVTLVVTCKALPEMRGLPQATTDSFVRLFEQGGLPDWLHEISASDDPLAVFAVQPIAESTPPER